jgi:hypothetical protein
MMDQADPGRRAGARGGWADGAPGGWIESAGGGWIDEDGLLWAVAGGPSAVGPEWFAILVAAMAAADPVDSLRSQRFAVIVDDAGFIDAQHPLGFRLQGTADLLTSAVCSWSRWGPEFAHRPGWSRQRAAFTRAYDTVRGNATRTLGSPTVADRDHDDERRRWSVWRIAEVIVAVHEAVADERTGLSIHTDIRRYPAHLPIDPGTCFADWIWDRI